VRPAFCSSLRCLAPVLLSCQNSQHISEPTLDRKVGLLKPGMGLYMPASHVGTLEPSLLEGAPKGQIPKNIDGIQAAFQSTLTPHWLFARPPSLNDDH
jgi:hypothetical protein